MVDSHEQQRHEERCAKHAHPSHKIKDSTKDLECPSCKKRGSPLLAKCTGPVPANPPAPTNAA